jgi:flagellin-like protein
VKKKGVSPVVATILLVVIVVIIALIIFLWARGFSTDKAQKDGRAIELSCEDIIFEAGIYLDGTIEVINRGNVPIYGVILKKHGEGVVIAKEVAGSTAGIGESFSVDIPPEISVDNGVDYNVIPVILGEAEEGKVDFDCPDQFGYVTRAE